MFILVFTKGLLTAMGLIIAIGAQNAFVLTQGLKRQYHWMVASVCTFFDLLFILLGVLGLATFLQSMPTLVRILQIVGALYLFYLAWQAAKRARDLHSLNALPQRRLSRRQALVTALAVTLANPQVFLETAFIIGTLASDQGQAKWAFAFGAMSTSILWFYGLSLLASKLAPLLARPRAWQCIDAFTTVLMTALGVMLLRS
ncbi:LysE family transporter [Gallaecimonas kandeliae]|uniref:LysE/ArgO family amino acid transporter n=1 Tax=Gallaecimonas kandeliae TaxID=3029055 RepID=UPI0026488D55|nr:LysE family transporter [Gallaecimonas kandeliae]WKE65213.1 LysE family transporter [Gallaecimonas kandeliae]